MNHQENHGGGDANLYWDGDDDEDHWVLFWTMLLYANVVMMNAGVAFVEMFVAVVVVVVVVDA